MRLVVTAETVNCALLSHLSCDGHQNQPHHQHHQPHRQQSGGQDLGGHRGEASEVKSAQHHPADQHAAPGGHEEDGLPVVLAVPRSGLQGPQGVFVGQAEDRVHGARHELLEGIRTVTEGQVLWDRRHVSGRPAPHTASGKQHCDAWFGRACG